MNSQSNLAPIVLFAYNRLEHTRRTIESLQRNSLSRESKLFIYSDGPQNEKDKGAVEKVRNYIKHIDGFKSVEIIERQENVGLANSIIEGVTSVVNLFSRVIVLEDDLLLAENFLDYMNRALYTYENDERVMHISGYMYPIDNQGLPETYFLRAATCWGWATWSRAWQYFEKYVDKCMVQFNRKMKKLFNYGNSKNFWSQIVGNKKGVLDTWAIFWYASIFLHDGLALHPNNSLVHNIGCDESGTDCSISERYAVEIGNAQITMFQKIIDVDNDALSRLIQYYRSNKKPYYRIVIDYIMRKYG